jgi:arylsulfatase A-like enzyme
MTVASFLKGQGYATACVGKWHLGLGSVEPTDYAKPLEPGPRAAGFDEFFGIPASLDMDPYVFVEDERVVEAPTARTGASGSQRDGGAGFWRAGPMAPSFRHADVLPRITERAVSLIERRAKETRPFFLYFALTAPHTPWLPSCEFAGKSGAGPYGDFVAQTDASVGKVLDALDRTGLAAGTLLVFTSDNGAHWLPGDIARWGHRANGPLRGQKADIHEGGHRVPFIVRWPGKVQAGSECSETICHLDLLSTFAAVLGAELPRDAGEDSFSILPALLGGKLPGPLRQATVHHSSGGLFAIRQGPWKLVVGRGSGGFTKVPEAADDPPGQLYHLERDPGERENLYRAEPAVVSRLTEILDRYRREGRSRP